MTIIEIRPFRNGWTVFEAPGVEALFLKSEGRNQLREGPQPFTSWIGQHLYQTAANEYTAAIDENACFTERILLLIFVFILLSFLHCFGLL